MQPVRGAGPVGREREPVFLNGHETWPKPRKDPVCSWTDPPTRAWAACSPWGRSKWEINIRTEATHNLGPGVQTAERPQHFLAMWLWESHFPHVNHSFLAAKRGGVH